MKNNNAKNLFFLLTLSVFGMIQGSNTNQNTPISTYSTNSLISYPKNEKDLTQTIHTLAEALKQKNLKHIPKSAYKSLKKETLEEYPDFKKNLQTTLMCLVPTPQEARLNFVGDLHGDTGPLDALLNDLTEKKQFDCKTHQLDPLTYIFLCGDIIDRGPNSLQNITLLTKLILANPNNVNIVRGNHETRSMMMQPGNLFSELKQYTKKYSTAKAILTTFLKACSQMPFVTFIQHGDKDHCIALTHGGINPHITQENIKTITEKLHQEQPTTWVLPNDKPEAYLWSDLSNSDEISIPTKNEERSVGYLLYQNNLLHWLMLCNTKLLVRGHQQYNENFIYKNKYKLPFQLFTQGLIRGASLIWDDTVITCNVAPNTGYYNDLENFEEDDFYSDLGTIITLLRKPNNFKNPIKKLPNTQPRLLKSLPDTAIYPIYFHPITHKIIHPQK